MTSQGSTQSLDRHRPFHRTTPCEAGFAGRSGQITGAQEMHCVAQLRGSLRATRKRHASLCGTQREAIPQQGVGHFLMSKHNMQVAKCCTRQKRHIFNGFSVCGGDPSGHPRWHVCVANVIRPRQCHAWSLHPCGALGQINAHEPP